MPSRASARPTSPANAESRSSRATRSQGRRYPLITQMRVQAGADYVGYVRRMLRGERSPGAGHPRPSGIRPPLLRRSRRDGARSGHGTPRTGSRATRRRLRVGLEDARTTRRAFDIEMDGVALRWNSTPNDWIASPQSLDEVGSIHTVQGYDLNYAGVIIGPDLRFDPSRGSSSSTASPTSTRRARRTTRRSDGSTPTTTCCGTSATSTACCSRAACSGPTSTSAILHYGSTCDPSLVPRPSGASSNLHVAISQCESWLASAFNCTRSCVMSQDIGNGSASIER